MSFVKNKLKEYNKVYRELCDTITEDDIYYKEIILEYDDGVPDMFIKVPIEGNEYIKEVLLDFASSNDYSLGNDVWFNSVKQLSIRHQFAENNKMFKANREAYLGHSGDVAEMIRIALTGSKQSPNLYFVIQILGKDEVNRRINEIVEKLA